MATKPFVYQDPYPARRGQDQVQEGGGLGEICFRRLVRRQRDPQGRSRSAHHPRQRGDARRLLPAPPGTQRVGGQDPARPGSIPERQGRGTGLPAQRRDFRPVRTPGLPGHRHRHHHRQERAAGLDRREGRGIPLQGRLQDLHRRESPVLPDRCARHVPGDQHRHQPAGPDRHPGRGRRRPTSSSSWPRAAAPPTRPPSSRRPRRCSPRKACCNSWSAR